MCSKTNQELGARKYSVIVVKGEETASSGKCARQGQNNSGKASWRRIDAIIPRGSKKNKEANFFLYIKL